MKKRLGRCLDSLIARTIETEELAQSDVGLDEIRFNPNQPRKVFDEAALAVDTITLAVQVSGKMRATIEVAADISKDDAIAAAKADEKVAKLLEGKTIRREIYVPGRLVNVVAN